MKSEELIHGNDDMPAKGIIVVTIILIYVIIINVNKCRLPQGQSVDASVYHCNI